MTRSPIRVLVVDDSAFMRRVLSKMLSVHGDIEVVATAMDGVFALDKLERVRPDVVTLDLEMPRMDGLTTLQRIVEDHQLPVILVSAHTSKGARETFEGLAAGAVDFVTKPERVFTTPLDQLGSSLAEKIRVAAKAKVSRPPDGTGERVRGNFSPARSSRMPAREVLAIAVSTGGPNALSLLLAEIRSDFQPGIVIVQHMPEGFTAQFAERLERLTAIGVREASEGDVVTSGAALVAPGGRHMAVERSGGRLLVRLSRTDPVRGHRPSADVLFRSVAKAAGARSIGMILTGMGEDGAEGMGAIQAAGGLTLAQDEASSVVYGTPRAAIERGFVQKVMPLSDMAAFLNALDTDQGGATWIA